LDGSEFRIMNLADTAATQNPLLPSWPEFIIGTICFAIVFGVHNLPLSWRVKKINLVVASSLFYAAWNPIFLLLLWISIIVDWHIATRMVRFSTKARRRLLLISLVMNLGMLCVFKYGNFVSANIGALSRLLGIGYEPTPDILAGFTVDNLLNEQYSRYLDYLPSPGVSVKGSLKIRFGAT